MDANLAAGRQTAAGQASGQGTRFWQAVSFLGGSSDVEREVIEVIANQRVSAKSVSGPFTFSDGYAVVAMNESN